MRFRRIALACLLLGAPLAAAPADKPPARLELSVHGVRLALEQAILSGLTLHQYRERSVSDTQLRRLVAVGENEVRATLEAWGYYDGKVESRIETRPDGFDVSFEVTPGDPVLVTSSEITVSGEAASDAAVASALKAFVPKVGERFDHAQYESSKTAVESALADHRLPARQSHGAQGGSHRLETQCAHHAQLGWRRALHIWSDELQGRAVSGRIPGAIRALEGRQ